MWTDSDFLPSRNDTDASKPDASKTGLPKCEHTQMRKKPGDMPDTNFKAMFKANVSRSFDRSQLFQHLSDSDDSKGEEAQCSLQSNSISNSEVGGNGVGLRHSKLEKNPKSSEPYHWVGISKVQADALGRIASAKKTVEGFLRGSPTNQKRSLVDAARTKSASLPQMPSAQVYTIGF